MSSCLINPFIIVLIVTVILKIFLKLRIPWNHSATCLIGKTTIVTGANTGIGFYTALDFAKRGAEVILACRNKERAEKAKSKIIQQTGNSNVIVRIVDLASLASVRDFVKEIKNTEERLDILVNNAGVFGLGNIVSEDGLDVLMQINYFGPALLTLLLIDLIKKSAPSRIVNVSSGLAYFAEVNPDGSNALLYKANQTNYANSKFYNIIFTNELARRLRGSGVVVNSLHPGLVATEIHGNCLPSPVLKAIADYVLPKLLMNPEEGAQTSIYVAVSKDIEGVTGEYFDNCRIAWLPPMPSLARDEVLAKKVWQNTEECIKLTFEEKQLLVR